MTETEKYIQTNTITSHKRCESMVMYALHYALRNVRLESQFKVGIYRIDGYLPDINLAVEIDEPHHSKQSDYDKQREEEIRKELNCEFIRLDVNQDVYTQVDELVRKVKALSPPHWTIEPKSTSAGEYSREKISGLVSADTYNFTRSLRDDVEMLGIKTYDCDIPGHIPESTGLIGFMFSFDGIEFSVSVSKKNEPKLLVTKYAEGMPEKLSLQLSDWIKGGEYCNIENFKGQKNRDEFLGFIASLTNLIDR